MHEPRAQSIGVGFHVHGKALGQAQPHVIRRQHQRVVLCERGMHRLDQRVSRAVEPGRTDESLLVNTACLDRGCRGCGRRFAALSCAPDELLHIDRFREALYERVSGCDGLERLFRRARLRNHKGLHPFMLQQR